jgi:hypothetical protein
LQSKIGIGIEIAIGNWCQTNVSKADFDSDTDSDFEFSWNPQVELNKSTGIISPVNRAGQGVVAKNGYGSTVGIREKTFLSPTLVIPGNSRPRQSRQQKKGAVRALFSN